MHYSPSSLQLGAEAQALVDAEAADEVAKYGVSGRLALAGEEVGKFVKVLAGAAVLIVVLPWILRR